MGHWTDARTGVVVTTRYRASDRPLTLLRYMDPNDFHVEPWEDEWTVRCRRLDRHYLGFAFYIGNTTTKEDAEAWAVELALEAALS